MVKKIIFLLLLPLAVFGGNLRLTNGLIEAHTKVFGDTSINPSVKNIQADLSMQDANIDSLKGKISFHILDFTSSEKGRDEHMQKMFDMKKYANISLKINKIVQKDTNYVIEGIISMHGVQKPVELNSTIVQNGSVMKIHSNFSVKVSDYGMQPPSLLFFTVRDAVDINASVVLTQGD
jgi:polyisoprenoid-binding protein YceI